MSTHPPLARSVSLKDVAFFQEGPGLRTHQWTAEGMKVINVTNILGDGAVDVSNTDKFIALSEFETRYSHFAVEENDIVVASSGNTYGKVGRIRSDHLPLMMNTSVIRFHSLEEAVLDDNFLYAWLRSSEFINQVKGFVTGGAQPNFGPTHLKQMRITLPEIHQQRAIAEILSAYDDLIENNRRRMALLDEAARQLYREWFVRIRFPGHEHVTIKDGVPEGWERKSLGELVEIKKGKNITEATAQEGTVPVVAGGLEPAYYHNKANATGPVVTISTSGANAGFVSIYHEDIWASDCSYISSESTGWLYYYYCFLKSAQQEVFGLQKGAAQPHVYPKDLMRLGIVSPPDRLLRYFTDAVEPSFALISNLNKQNRALLAARDLLLPRLVSGELAV
ncbi:MAG: restriction endonuclease subunit S [Gemmatimonadales bacterium]